MSSSFPKDFLWGGATADFQYEGGFNEGGRGINSQDFVTSGSVKQKRQITFTRWFERNCEFTGIFSRWCRSKAL